jgi:hypothetical protein
LVAEEAEVVPLVGEKVVAAAELGFYTLELIMSLLELTQ